MVESWDQRVNGRFCLMRYSSVASTAVNPRKDRRRLGFFVCARWRRPALERRTLPLAVILNRLATDFFVLMPLGRRINQILLFKKSAQYKYLPSGAQEIISLNSSINPSHAARWPIVCCRYRVKS